MVECANCGRQLLPDSMRIHQRKCTRNRPQKVSRRMKRKVVSKKSAIPAAEIKPNQGKPKRRAPETQARVSNRNIRGRGANNQMKSGRRQYAPKDENQGGGGYGRQYQKRQEEKKPVRASARNQRGRSRGGSRRNNPRNQRQQRKPSPQNDRWDQPSDNQRGFANQPDQFQKRSSYDQMGTKGVDVPEFAAPQKMAQCRVCGRTFAKDRIAKHQKACKKASKKPKKVKVFVKKLSKREKMELKKKKAAKGKPKWKQQHDAFIKQMKYMKKLKEIEQKGGDIREIAPLESEENPDFLPCKFCGRKFREAAHARHEGICQKVFGGKKNVKKPKQLTGKAARRAGGGFAGKKKRRRY